MIESCFKHSPPLQQVRELMECLVRVLDGVILISQDLSDSRQNHFLDHVKVIHSDALQLLVAFERSLRRTIAELKNSVPSIPVLREIVANLPTAQNRRELKIQKYLNALNTFYLSKNIDYRLRDYLRIVDRGVVQPIIGPARTNELGESLAQLIASNRIKSGATRGYLISRISWHLTDLPKTHDELTESLAAVLNRAVRR